MQFPELHKKVVELQPMGAKRSYGRILITLIILIIVFIVVAQFTIICLKRDAFETPVVTRDGSECLDDPVWIPVAGQVYFFEFRCCREVDWIR